MFGYRLALRSVGFIIALLLASHGIAKSSYQGGHSKGCNPDPSWFPHQQTPEPDPNAFKSSSNCEFHQYSWHSFLWLTQNDKSGKPRFLSFVSPESLLGLPGRGMMPRMTKNPRPESFDEYLQAGSDGILVDQNQRAVYYSQYLDKNYVDFIIKNKLTDPKVAQKFDPNKSFTNGVMELKVSWKIVAQGEDVSDFFTMDTEVQRLVNQNGKIVIDPDSSEKVTVALVGFHIGVVVEGHPEMIWATFEHKDNAPNVPEVYKPDTVISKKDWTFYKGGTPYSQCNVNAANTPNQTLDEQTQKLSPVTQVCRQYEFGNDPNNPESLRKSMKQNDKNIASLNKKIRKRLRKKDIWSNYHEVGAIWFLPSDALQPNMSLATDFVNGEQLITGSLKLSNSTIETYTQTQSTLNNCFRCHNTMQQFPPKMGYDPLPGLNINISHAFVNIYFWSQMKN